VFSRIVKGKVGRCRVAGAVSRHEAEMWTLRKPENNLPSRLIKHAIFSHFLSLPAFRLVMQDRTGIARNWIYRNALWIDALASGNSAPSYLRLCSSWTNRFYAIFSHILCSETFGLKLSTAVSSRLFSHLNTGSRSAYCSALNLGATRFSELSIHF
jgi:hypothetical protein